MAGLWLSIWSLGTRDALDEAALAVWALGVPPAPVLLPVLCTAADGAAFPGAGSVLCACHLSKQMSYWNAPDCTPAAGAHRARSHSDK